MLDLKYSCLVIVAVGLALAACTAGEAESVRSESVSSAVARSCARTKTQLRPELEAAVLDVFGNAGASGDTLLAIPGALTVEREGNKKWIKFESSSHFGVTSDLEGGFKTVVTLDSGLDEGGAIDASKVLFERMNVPATTHQGPNYVTHTKRGPNETLSCTEFIAASSPKPSYSCSFRVGAVSEASDIHGALGFNVYAENRCD